MLYLQIDGPEGGELYFDIQQVEERRLRGRTFFAVTGVCGDGRWEGEVLVEVADEVEVTFIDEWLHAERLKEFFQRHERPLVEAGLRRLLAGLRVCLENLPVEDGTRRSRIVGCAAQGRWLPQRPRYSGDQLELPLAVGESGPLWQRSAA